MIDLIIGPLLTEPCQPWAIQEIQDCVKDDLVMHKAIIASKYTLQDVYTIFGNIFIAGLQKRVRIGKLFSLFLIQNICCGYSKEPYQ